MKFPVVCICGSTRFEQETKRKAEELTLQGEIVLMVNCWSKKDKLHEPQNPLDETIKEMLDKIHKEKIRMSDYIFVMNVGGYWGKSTQSEIEYANKIGIPIKYLEPPEYKKCYLCGEVSKEINGVLACGGLALDRNKPTKEAKE